LADKTIDKQSSSNHISAILEIYMSQDNKGQPPQQGSQTDKPGQQQGQQPGQKSGQQQQAQQPGQKPGQDTNKDTNKS
jgi:hypothetical protein